MDISFKNKPKVSKFDYYYLDSPFSQYRSFFLEKLFEPAFIEVKLQYKIKFKKLEFGKIPKLGKNKTLYVIYGPIFPFDINKKEWEYIKKLGNVPRIKLNIVSAYILNAKRDSAEYLKFAESKVKFLSKEFNANFIFPDNLYENFRSTDFEDVRDNIVCETMRVKYLPKRINENFNMNSQTKKLIRNLSKLFLDYRLWHRDRTDGAILINSENNVLVSQTKSDKSNLNYDNFSLVKKYDSKKNEIFFVGEKIPSSDSPEFLVLNELNKKKFNLIIHFHFNDITRSKDFKESITKEKIEYGRFSSGEKIYMEMKEINSNWCILLEHGILWLGNSVEEFELFLKKDLNLKNNINLIN